MNPSTGLDAARIQMAIHLRLEHGWGIRRIAKRLVMSEKAVRWYCEKDRGDNV